MQNQILYYTSLECSHYGIIQNYWVVNFHSWRYDIIIKEIEYITDIYIKIVMLSRVLLLFVYTDYSFHEKQNQNECRHVLNIS